MSNDGRRAAAKKGLALGAGALLAVVCPPAALGAAAAALLGGARRYAKTGDPRDAETMVSGYSDLSSLSKNTKK